MIIQHSMKFFNDLWFLFGMNLFGIFQPRTRSVSWPLMFFFQSFNKCKFPIHEVRRMLEIQPGNPALLSQTNSNRIDTI